MREYGSLDSLGRILAFFSLWAFIIFGGSCLKRHFSSTDHIGQEIQVFEEEL